MWTIQSTSTVSLQFVGSFDLESGYDWVRVYEVRFSGSETLIGAFTGGTVPSPLSAPSGVMKVRFTSDSSINGLGFVALYSVAPNELQLVPGSITDVPTSPPTVAAPISDVPLSGCPGANITAPSAMASPIGRVWDGPGNYLANTFCRWFIRSEGNQVVLSFIGAFDIESGYDWVRVYEVQLSGNELLIGAFTGRVRPSSAVTARFGLMKVIFTSDSSVNADGWMASYSIAPWGTALEPFPSATFAPTAAPTQTPTAGPVPPTVSYCPGSYLTSQTGILGDGPGAYSSNLNCVWFIQADGRTINVIFNSFDLEFGYDFVRLYELQASGNEMLIASYTGRIVPSAVAARNGMKVIFTSDPSVQGDGWSASYSVT
jgi:putative methionine-R-sulfoxide reductase with GAF domain